MKAFFGQFRGLVCIVVLALASTVSAQTFNEPPRVFMVSPFNGAYFTAGADIPLVAEARDVDGSVVEVQFYAGERLLGIGLWASSSIHRFAFVWREVPAGEYVLTLLARDNLGATRRSMPVKILVRSPEFRQPIVTVRAADPYASEPCAATTLGDPAVFVIHRSSGTNIDLLVNFTLSGTAESGVDYAEIPDKVVIPKGRWAVEIPVRPLADKALEGSESVVLRIQPLACITIYPPPPDCYLVGQPAEAVAYIRDCVEPVNRAPLVKFVKPVNGMVYRAPANIEIQTDTFDVDGYVWKVEFFERDKKIGEGSKLFFVAPPDGTHIPYGMTWKEVPVGKYLLLAKATDAEGAVGISTPVEIVVVSGDPPPPPPADPPLLAITTIDPVALEGTNCWGWTSLTNRWPDGSVTDTTFDPDNLIRYWWFTNCAPKSAAFVIRRLGNTNAEVIVEYAIGGTAVNGVDYDLLPGVVKIPAGERKARILIVPKDDEEVEPIETVILELKPAPAGDDRDPAYLLTRQNRAAVIIADSRRPRPDTASLSDNTFHLGTDAVDGDCYRIEYSTDLVTWTAVSTNQAALGALHFVDPEAQEVPLRFYRAIPTAPPAQD